MVLKNYILMAIQKFKKKIFCGYHQEQLYNARFDLLHIYYFKSNGSLEQFKKKLRVTTPLER